MRGLRALAWLACVGACAGQHVTIPPPRAAKQDAVDASARDVTAETQTMRPAFEQGRRRLDCVDDLTTRDEFGDDCSWYADNSANCGCCDDEDFTASEQCCMCGGFLGKTQAPTATPAPTLTPLVADDSTIRTAVALWLSDRTAAEATYGHISSWETGGVTNMACLLSTAAVCDGSAAAASFNEAIGAWDTSGVTSMGRMFQYATAFNQPIGGWRVDNVTDMGSMFSGASSFNQPIGNWRVDQVTSVWSMFMDASAFDQDLGWCLADGIFAAYESGCSGCNTVKEVFAGAACESTSCGILWGGGCDTPRTGKVMVNWKIRWAVAAWLSDATAAEATYGHISTWETGGVTDMSYLFCDSTSQYHNCYNSGASLFNEDISAWDTSGVAVMKQMFARAWLFNQPLGGWRVDKVTDMRYMFHEAFSFNQSLGWCVDGDVDMNEAFKNTKCESTSCGIAGADCEVLRTGNVMVSWKIKQAITAWFSNRTAAEVTYGHISTWETGGVTDMSYLFCSHDDDCYVCSHDGDCYEFYNKAAASFNDNITAWDTSGVTSMSHMFYEALAFDQPIGGWNVSKVTEMDTTFDGASSFNQPLNDWRVANVKSMSYMFWNAKSFNQPLNDWRVDKVTSMSQMFYAASSFNQPLGDWRVDKVTDMSSMFSYASAFNQPLNDWRVDEVTNMDGMFGHALSFNQPLGDWKLNKVTNMGRMFEGDSAFDQTLGWCVNDNAKLDEAFSGTACASISCGVVRMTEICSPPATKADIQLRIKVKHWLVNTDAATAQYGSIGAWDTREVTNMAWLFCADEDSHPQCNSEASTFDEDIGAWDLSGVTSMESMFTYASQFTQPIADWNWKIGAVTNMNRMFAKAESFDQKVPWCVSDTVETVEVFAGAKCGLNCYEPCSGSGVCTTGGICQCSSAFVGDQCEKCAAGFYGVDCQRCDDNTWSKAGIEPTCDLCRVGYYREGDECISCGEDKVCETTDVTLDNFECIAGTYRDGDECKPCKHGMRCEAQGVTLQNVRLEHDKWRTSENSDVIEDCPLTDACQSPNETQSRRRLSDSGNSTEEEYDAGENLCASGYHGPLCAVCRNHHYRSGNECKKCSRGSEALNIILACAVFVGFVVAAALSIIHSQNFLKKSMDYFKKGEEAVDGLADNAEATEAIWRTVKTGIKQMLGMWSVVSNTPWILDVTYPKIFDKVLAFLSNVFSFDFTIAADCAVNRMGFKDTLLLNTLVPFVLCALIALLALVVAKWPRKKMAREQDGVQKQSVQYAFNIILFIVFLSYTTASTTIFRALRPCHKFDEAYHGSNKYMKDDYGTSCHSNRHQFIRAYAWIMLFIYPIGVPLLTFVFLWRHRETLNPDVRVKPENRDLGGRADGAQKKSVGACTDISLRRSCHALLGRSSDAHGHFDEVQREIVDAKIARRGELIKNMQKGRGFLERPELFGFMYDNYEPEYWWFECFDYIRRLLLTGILVVFEPGSATQGLFGVLVALFGTQVYSWTRPFPENAGDRLAESAQWSTFFTFLAALMILVNVNAANSTEQTFFGVLLIVIQFMPIAIGVGVGALNKNLKVKGKAQGLDKEAKGLGDKISSEEPESEHRSSDATAGVTGRDEADEEQPATSDTN